MQLIYRIDLDFSKISCNKKPEAKHLKDDDPGAENVSILIKISNLQKQFLTEFIHRVILSYFALWLSGYLLP